MLGRPADQRKALLRGLTFQEAYHRSRGPILCLCYRQDGMLAAGTWDGDLLLWNPDRSLRLHLRRRQWI